MIRLSLLTTLVVVASALFWLETGIAARLGRRRVPGLKDLEPIRDESLPTLTIVAAAKDEASRVEEAARSLLRQDYPNLTVIVVDDRSSDGTSGILDRLAAENPRLRVVHITSLPEDWIGKCHALAQGAGATDSEWILVVDGDVTLAPEAARRGVWLAVRQGWDHGACGPG